MCLGYLCGPGRVHQVIEIQKKQTLLGELNGYGLGNLGCMNDLTASINHCPNRSQKGVRQKERSRSGYYGHFKQQTMDGNH